MKYKILAGKIKRYYFKKGNRLIFTNGMTLNKLAIEMWENLNESGIDSSVISRVIKGDRLFSFRQLGVFCTLLKIRQRERNALFECLNRDILINKGVYVDKHFFNRLTKSIHKESFSELMENTISKTGLVYSKKSYYQLINDGLDFRETGSDHMENYSVKIPVCSFGKTLKSFDNNCHCSYHLALYGVINRSIRLNFNRLEIQKEINNWSRYFFPEFTY